MQPLDASHGLPLPQSKETVNRRRRRRRIVLGLLLCVLVIGIYTQFWQRPRVALGVLTSQLTPDGQQETTGDVSDAPSLSGQMTAVQSNQSTSTGSTTSRSSGATWPRESIVIYCESDHLLMQRVGLALFEGLQQSDIFPRVQYVPRGQSLPVGEAVPDILVSLLMPEYSESGLPVAKQYQLKLVVHVGREFAQGNSYSITSFTPPVVNFSADIRMDYTGKQTGIETSGAQYTTVSKDIAKALQKSILGLFKKEDDLPLPARQQIAEFYPDFQPPSELPFLEPLHAVAKFCGPRFMQPTSAAWTFTSEQSRDELQRLIDPPLTADGWKGRDVATNPQAEGPYQGHWSRGVESLSVISSESASVFDTNQPSSSGPRTYSIVYTRNMTDAESEQAFRALLDRPVTEAVLLPFVNRWHLGKDRIVAHFQDHAPTHADSYRILAEWKLGENDQAAAQALVLKGYAIDRLLAGGHQRSTFEQLAKKAGLEKLTELMEPEVVESLGLPDFREGTEFDVICAAGDITGIWVQSAGREQTVLKLHCRKNRSGLWSMSHEVITIHEHGSSHTSSNSQDVSLEKPHSMYAGLNDVRLELVAEQTDNPDQVRFRITRQATHAE